MIEYCCDICESEDRVTYCLDANKMFCDPCHRKFHMITRNDFEEIDERANKITDDAVDQIRKKTNKVVPIR